MGAGIVGLSAARALQLRGVTVTIYDQASPGSGATKGNAGWVTPGLVEPLGSPLAARQGVSAMLRPGAPVTVADATPATLGFLASLLRHSTASRFDAGVRALRPLAEKAIPAYEQMEGSGLSTTPILAVFSDEPHRERFIEEHHQHPIEIDRITAAEAHQQVPSLSGWARSAAMIQRQAFVDPQKVATSLARLIEQSGGRFETGTRVLNLQQDASRRVLVRAERSRRVEFDAAVVATGAQAGDLLRNHGVRLKVLAGRGYSFSTMKGNAPSLPIYVPEHRLACTPIDGSLRIVGVMEFGKHGAPPNDRRIKATARAAQHVFGDNVDAVEETWVGSRPCTSDGLPLLGATSSACIYAAVGHGMWGMTLGPISGELLARQIVGETVPELASFDPLRRLP